ncbi:MAG: zinc ribbon domain-containing protein, partial [Acidobacteria bacterium]|nr:zinc ribbon domain-containing protein [Acidobacteriota bacterium]
MRVVPWCGLAALVAVVLAAVAPAAGNLVQDPSFEVPKERDQFGLVFAKWGGWKYEGDCDFAVGRVARTGKHSCLLVGGTGAKIRAAQNVPLEPGRYRITAYLRGLDIGTGTWNMTTEFMFDGRYVQLGRNGTFGWTPLAYVGEITEKKEAGPSFGLMAPGYLWIDDVAMEKVADDVPLTEKPVLGAEESPIAPPGEIGPGAVRCPECGYRNMPAWKTCYACGTPLEAKKAAAVGPPVRPVTSFEDRNPFDGGEVVESHATDGAKALRIDRSYVCMDGPQDWTGYDYLKADVFTDSADPVQLYVEIRDTATRDYWTRVNYTTVVPPGASTFILPVKQMYVGEKSRPGRMLILNGITRLVFSIGDKPAAPLYVDHVRLERDESVQKVLFDGLLAFDLGSGTSPVMEGFTPITAATLYSKGRGYGLKDAKVWRVFDALQPDPLYQDFICIESGGLVADVPNGRYRVVVNLDSPSGFWGEYQTYRRRAVLAQGKEAAVDTMDFEAARAKYFRFWDTEDLPADNTFDKYQKVYFREKTFEVDVTDGQLRLGFEGQDWACSVSAVIAFPVERAAEGARFLKFVEDRRRFHFDNYFKRILHRPTGDPLKPSAADRQRGYVVFRRDIMKDVYYNDTPLAAEVGGPLAGAAFAGEYAPLTLSVLPLADLGKVTVEPGDLAGPGGTIPAAAIDVGFV